MTLHNRLLAELDRLAALAEVSTPWKTYPSEEVPFQIQYGDFGPGIVGTPMGEWEDTEQGRRDAAFARSVANPADALRRYAAARRVLERHHPASSLADGQIRCWWCAPRDSAWPCDDIRDLADSLGIEVSP